MRTVSLLCPAACRLLALASLLVTGAHALQYRQTNNTEFDYIVIGSGPGGGPLASNLARAGFETLLIEAGDDEFADPSSHVINYFVSTGIHDNLHWDFYVKHCQYRSSPATLSRLCVLECSRIYHFGIRSR